MYGVGRGTLFYNAIRLINSTASVTISNQRTVPVSNLDGRLFNIEVTSKMVIVSCSDCS